MWLVQDFAAAHLQASLENLASVVLVVCQIAVVGQHKVAALPVLDNRALLDHVPCVQLSLDVFGHILFPNVHVRQHGRRH